MKQSIIRITIPQIITNNSKILYVRITNFHGTTNKNTTIKSLPTAVCQVKSRLRKYVNTDNHAMDNLYSSS